MLNMKKLIDETDFDNLNQLTKQWKNADEEVPVVKQHSKINSQKRHSQQSHHFETHETQKQNNSHHSNQISNVSILTKRQDQPKTHSKTITQAHSQPQIIDHDTEHFKNNLEHLLNTFKIDAVSEFVAMKKDMLEYQKQSVKNDTQKYLTMYEEKNEELLKTKQRLLQISRQAEKKTMQVQLLSEHIAKLNNRLRSVQSLSIPFAVLFKNKQEQKMLKFKQKQAKIFDMKRLKRKSIWGWVALYKQHKDERTKKENQEKVENQVNEIVGRFQKQMDMLKYRLEQATRKNEQYEGNKVMLQENLKKAFLRGVTAMNMEAMGVLGDNMQEDDWVSSKQQSNTIRSQKEQTFTSNISYMDPYKNSNANQSCIQNQSMYVGKSKQASNLHYTNITSNLNNTNQQIVMISNPKSQSKNHKWKQAPIVGIDEKIVNEEPRMQVVRPTTQGKVIKVIDGKSSIDNGSIKKSIPEIQKGTSRKKI